MFWNQSIYILVFDAIEQRGNAIMVVKSDLIKILNRFMCSYKSSNMFMNRLYVILISKYFDGCANKVAKTNLARGAYLQSLPDIYPYRSLGRGYFIKVSKWKKPGWETERVNWQISLFSWKNIQSNRYWKWIRHLEESG